MTDTTKYVTVSIPKGIADRIDSLVTILGYWPSRSSFVREAILDKFDKESKAIIELRTIEEFNSPLKEMKMEDASHKIVETEMKDHIARIGRKNKRR